MNLSQLKTFLTIAGIWFPVLALAFCIAVGACVFLSDLYDDSSPALGVPLDNGATERNAKRYSAYGVYPYRYRSQEYPSGKHPATN